MPFERGSLIKLKEKIIKKIFWVDGPLPAITHSLKDDNGVVTKRYLSGRNGFKTVTGGSLLLFLGQNYINTVDEDGIAVENNKDTPVIKFLFENQVIFWPTISEPEYLLDIFECIVQTNKES